MIASHELNMTDTIGQVQSRAHVPPQPALPDEPETAPATLISSEQAVADTAEMGETGVTAIAMSEPATGYAVPVLEIEGTSARECEAPALGIEPELTPVMLTAPDSEEACALATSEAAPTAPNLTGLEITDTAPSATDMEELAEPEDVAPARMRDENAAGMLVGDSAVPLTDAPLPPDTQTVPANERAAVIAPTRQIAPAFAAPAPNPALAMALKFAERGIPVFPLFGIAGDNCTCGNRIESGKCSAGKHPRHTDSFKGATTNIASIETLFKYSPQMNYGVATGRRKGDTDKVLVVVDIDWYKPQARQTMEDLNLAGYFFPDTAEVLTGGGGRHLYYWAKAGTKFAKTAGPGIDLKGEGGYVVGPGSMHKSGTRYDFEASSDLFNGQEIAEVPQWMYDKFGKPDAMELAAPPSDVHVAPSVDEVPDAEMAAYKADLELISPLEYDTWCEVLMALKNRRDSEQMFGLADWWSQKEGYKGVDVVRKKWNNIKVQGGITIKGLKRLAAKATPNTDVDLTNIMVANARVTPGEEIKWPAPTPIHFGIETEAYPLDALPELLKSAVIEVQSFTMAPIAMVACSALSTLSLAAQALYDIKRAEGLSGPIGLFMLTVANSGERKTTLDGMFSAPIHDYETRRAAEAKTTLSEFTADLSAWEATRKGILDGITKAVGGKNATTSNAALRAHEITQPVRPLVPRLVYGDVTPEALKHNLAVEWPSGGIISSEGGAVFGGHGMKKDNQMGNLATLNELWDGKPGRTDRRTTQAAILKSARLTVAIQVQEPTLKAFLGGSNALARGTGFLARFLIAWPATTMGTRAFVEPPPAWPMRDRFRHRLTAILNSPQPIVDRELKPNMLTLTTGAKAAWVAFHNEIESQLGLTGSYHAVCDVASKAADNAVRIAALFHVLEGETDAVSEKHMVGASRIARWHLNESYRLYGGLTVPAELEVASKLNDWLVAYCKKENVLEISTKDLMQRGPSALRLKAALMPVVEQLVSLGRVKISVTPASTIYINPALLD